jgi:hypothetical protein
MAMAVQDEWGARINIANHIDSNSAENELNEEVSVLCTELSTKQSYFSKKFFPTL